MTRTWEITVTGKKISCLVYLEHFYILIDLMTELYEVKKLSAKSNDEFKYFRSKRQSTYLHLPSSF